MISITFSLVLLGSPQIAGPSVLDPQLDPAALHSEVAARELAADTQEQVVTTEYWAGHQVAFGNREVPVLGTLDTRMDNYTIARVRRGSDQVQIDQRACKVRYSDPSGLEVHIDADSLPDSRLIFERVEGTPHFSMTGSVDWGEEDIDKDGNPGMAVYIDASVCSGTLHVTNHTTTNARAFGDDKGTPFYGEVTISVRQKILAAEGRCLSALAEDSFERSKGSFRYVKIKADDTCQSLLDAGWPVRAK